MITILLRQKRTNVDKEITINMNTGNQDSFSQRIDINNTTEITCEECGSKFFTEVMTLRKASKLLTGAANDQIVPIPVIRCADCGHVNNDFMPKL